jgi:hypothetical protein
MPKHEWTLSAARTSSGAKLWHCALCGREVQSLTQPDAEPCDEGKRAGPSCAVCGCELVRHDVRNCGPICEARDLERRKVDALERIVCALERR